MKIVSYPEGFESKFTSVLENFLKEGKVAEGDYYNEKNIRYIKNKFSVPVSSGGTAIYTLLAYQKYVNDKTHVIIQSNTMRALYTIPKLLGMEVLVADSSIDPGFMAMDPKSLKNTIDIAYKNGLKDKLVIVYSVIGGYLAKAYDDVELLAKENNIPLIIDMAHGHYLNRVINSDYAELAFSFYATKILPTGEGGLITTHKENTMEWIRRFLAYDRFHYELQVGLNLRVSELTAYFIYELMSNESYEEYFKDRRIKVAEVYKQSCIQNNIKFLDYTAAQDYNGYKFIVFDDFEALKSKNLIITKYGETSPVFNYDVVNKTPHLVHWCPPTYPSLYDDILKK